MTILEIMFAIALGFIILTLSAISIVFVWFALWVIQTLNIDKKDNQNKPNNAEK